MEMLIVLAKGAKPLKFACWGTIHSTDERGLETSMRNPEGLRLMSGDKAAFDAMAAVQAWAAKYRDLLDSDDWFASKPFTPTTIPISSLSRFLIRSGGAYI